MPTALINLAVALYLLGRSPVLPDQTPPPAEPIVVADDRAAPRDEGLADDDVDVDPAVGRLLEQLERSAEDLRSFTADVIYESEDALIGRREVRRGRLVYDSQPDRGLRRFAVLFDTIDRNRRREQRLKHYVFDGQWLAEVDQENRQFIKRQIVPPGERLDPLKLGEGPFPLPVGQPRDEVVTRFEATPLPVPSDGPLAKVAEDYAALEGLLLVPRAGTPEAEDYERIELLYDRSTLLPVGINLLETGGDRKTVRLRDARRNPELDAEQLRMLRIEEPDPSDGWSVSVQPWSRR